MTGLGEGTPGVKATAAVKLHEFKDVDVIAFITFKGVIDGASQNKTATQTALQVGHMLEDEQGLLCLNSKIKNILQTSRNIYQIPIIRDTDAT